MSDRFKFRAYCEQHGYVRADFRHSEHGLEAACEKHTCFTACRLEQCTGLRDKDGTLIYEGDVVEAFCNINRVSDPHLAPKTPPEFDRKVVRFCRGAFVLSSARHSVCGVLDYNTATKADTLTVLGNIHANPELMEGE